MAEALEAPAHLKEPIVDCLVGERVEQCVMNRTQRPDVRWRQRFGHRPRRLFGR